MDAEDSRVSRAGLMATRVVGPVTYILLLLRVPLMVGAVLIVTLSDLAIPDAMREAMRYAVLDDVQQLAFIALGVLLVCTALRLAGEGMIELVAPDLFASSGNVGRLAHFLPRALALSIGLMAALPLLELAADPASLSESGSASAHRLIAGAAGLGFIVIGLVVAILPRVRAHANEIVEGRAGFLERFSVALLPLLFAVIVCTALFGWWRDGTGMAFDALARYRDQGIKEIAVESITLYLCCISVRLAATIVATLLFSRKGEGIPGHVVRSVQRLAALTVGASLAIQFVVGNLGPHGALVPDTLWRVIAIALGYVAIGTAAAFSETSWLLVPQNSDAFDRTGRRWRAATDRFAMLAPAWKALFTTLFLLAIGITAIFILIVRVDLAQVMGPVSIILIWGFAATFLFFPIAYAAHMTRMPLLLIFLLAGVAFAGFDLNDNHEIRSAAPETPVRGQSAYGEKIDLGAWISSRADLGHYTHYPVFLVATEGGGIRAAYFTASVLSVLQDRCPLFAQHTLAISGVSGGSVGAAVFAALTADRARNLASASCDVQGRGTSETVTARARQVLSTDLLSPLISKMLFPDALQRVLPLAIGHFDRARAIEIALEKAWEGANTDCAPCSRRMSQSVDNLYAWPSGHARAPVPHLFLNTTEVKSGRIIPFATGHVLTLATPFLEQAEIDQPGLAALRQLTLQDHMTDQEAAAPLSAAAMLSARFPYLTPAGLIANSGHYVDGGYFENSGTSVVAGLLQNLIGQKFAYRNAANPALEAAVRNSVFVTIVIHSEPCISSCEIVGAGPTGADSSWNEIMSPVRALLNTREQRAEDSITDLDALTALVEQLSAAPGAPNPVDRGIGCDVLVCSVTLSFGSAPNTEVPLSWLLSRAARRVMDDAVERMMHADVSRGVPASATLPETSDQPPSNTVLGSYSRVLCLLATRDGKTGCGSR